LLLLLLTRKQGIQIHRARENRKIVKIDTIFVIVADVAK